MEKVDLLLMINEFCQHVGKVDLWQDLTAIARSRWVAGRRCSHSERQCTKPRLLTLVCQLSSLADRREGRGQPGATLPTCLSHLKRPPHTSPSTSLFLSLPLSASEHKKMYTWIDRQTNTLTDWLWKNTLSDVISVGGTVAGWTNNCDDDGEEWRNAFVTNVTVKCYLFTPAPTVAKIPTRLPLMSFLKNLSEAVRK